MLDLAERSHDVVDGVADSDLVRPAACAGEDDGQFPAGEQLGFEGDVVVHHDSVSEDAKNQLSSTMWPMAMILPFHSVSRSMRQ